MKFSELRDRLLVALLETARREGVSEYYDLKAVADSARLPYESGEITLCARYFDEHGYVNGSFTMGGGPDGGLHVAIAAEGIEEAEELEEGLEEELFEEDFEEEPSLQGDISRLELSFLDHTFVIACPPGEEQRIERLAELLAASAENLRDDLGKVGDLRLSLMAALSVAAELDRKVLAPAADRVVPLNHNSPEYQDATTALDDVIEVVRSDNEYGDRAPEEKEQLVASLTAGRRLLNAATVRLSAAYAILLPPLRYVADNFGKGVITAAGAVALAAIVKLLGIL